MTGCVIHEHTGQDTIYKIYIGQSECRAVKASNTTSCGWIPKIYLFLARLKETYIFNVMIFVPPLDYMHS